MMSSAFRAQAPNRLWTFAQRSFSTSTVLRRINKICASENDAIQKVKSGSTVLVGGFGFSGVPESLIEAVAARKDLKDLTVVSNNAGMPGVGLGTCTNIAADHHVNIGRPIAGNPTDQQNDSILYRGE